MQTLPIQISSTKAEGILQVSKWLKIQVLLDVSEMQELLKALGSVFFVVVSQPVKADEAVITPESFLNKYAEYISLLKQELVPTSDEFRRFFSCAISSSLDAFYAMVAGPDKYLIKPKKPVMQLQAHQFFYSDLDGKFHPMVLSPDSVSWGLQISYPQLFQDPITRQVVKVIDSSDFPSTGAFTKLLKWIRNFTLPTPFAVKAERTNSPIRIGKQSLSWVQNHPQLKQKGIQIFRISG